jgi:hypothetical protein
MLAVQTSLHELGPLDEEDRLVEARTRLAAFGPSVRRPTPARANSSTSSKCPGM